MHLNNIDQEGTRWQTYNELRSKGIGCEPAFSLLTTIATETVKWNSQVTVSRDGGARREAGREREMRVYKQAPCNKFVFSRCQVPWPSLRLSVRSILFGLACARASAINFTECYEPLIRLANGACNLAEAKPTVLWIADKLLQKLQLLWLNFLCVFVCVKLSDCDCACAYIHSPSTCVSLVDLKASWQLLIFHQKKKTEAFHLAHPTFLCLSQIGWKWNGFFHGEHIAQNGQTIERGRALKQLGWAVIYFHLHKITGLFDQQASSCHHMNETWPRDRRRRWISAVDTIGEKETIRADVCKHKLSTWPITMAFGYILNAV